MKWEKFIKFVGYQPVIDTEILLAGVINPMPIKVQISRWLKAGKLIQVKRGIYALSEPYRKVQIYEPYVASLLKKPSYLSLEKALEFHNLIPEAVPLYTSLTTKGTGKFTSKLGNFDYKHIKKSLFWGYDSVTVNGQIAFIASPEKAMLDLIYFKGMKISFDYLEELRLQDLDKINLDKLLLYAKRFKKPGILRAAEVIKKYINSAKSERKVL